MPLYFEKDDQTLLVATNEGRETMAVFRYDPNARKLANSLRNIHALTLVPTPTEVLCRGRCVIPRR